MLVLLAFGMLCVYFGDPPKIWKVASVGDRQASSFLMTPTLVYVYCGYFFNMALKIFRKDVL